MGNRIVLMALLLCSMTVFSQKPLKYQIDFDYNPLTPSRFVFSPDCRFLTYGTEEGEIIGFEVETGKEAFRFQGHSKRVICLDYSPDGKILASGDKDGKIKIWNMEDRKERMSYPAHEKAVMAVAYSPDNSMLFSGGRDNFIHIRESNNGAPIKTIGKTRGNIRTIRFSPDGKHIICATSALSYGVQYYDIKTGEVIKRINSANTEYVDISPDEKIFATANLKPDVYLWDVEEGTQLATLKGHTEYVKGVSFSPGGKVLASCSDDKTVKLWDVEKRGCLYTFTDHTENVEFVAYSPDGKWLATAGWDDKINIYDLTVLPKLPKEEIYVKPDNSQLNKDEQEIVVQSFANLEFETGKAGILESSFPSLTALANLLKAKKSYKLTITGHTDNTGDASFNYNLSILRAEAVKAFLTGKGVPENQITATGFGATKPLADNRTEEGKKKNRRVEFSIKTN